VSSDNFLQRILDAVEEQEARLLVWGLADGCLNRGELIAIIDPILDKEIDAGLTDFYDAEGVIDVLSGRGLVFSTESGSYPGFRSRMGETIRLLYHLRQLFPKHAGRDGWQNARTLVSDFRFLRRPRKFPRREIAVNDAISQISKSVRSKPIKLAIRAILENRDDNFALSEFQVQASMRLLDRLETSRSSGTLISAGTGSGKTLAFYLPALARIASHIVSEKAGRNWVKCLALYPRTELLKDQLSEIYKEARRLDPLIQKSNRKLRIGAFFGATPYNGKTLLNGQSPGWRRSSDGFICGFMGCPTAGCGGDLVWHEVDIHQEREHLICSTCGSEITDDEITLTRRRLEKDPPDILFTTTEMLNQRLSDSRYRHLFGLRPQAVKPPEMMLLDEVHAYSAFHGAQVAYLLRRWLHLVRAPINFVGLSATLRGGKSFFAQLTGLFESQIEEIAPKHDEMIAEGAEYLVALKGDPVSKASLLSTTIQTAMLLSRMLDLPNGIPSQGVFGSKLFAFTDDIDVINRLYFGLLDAEGRSSAGQPDMVRHPTGGLAVYRTPILSSSRERNGQNWSTPIAIGHDLSDRKRIGRTSSQDPGVVADLDVVVATASLEVGFNDPSVAAIIQHKAPRNVASFLQRKGRAGRSQKMRPWTILVLSDYGRDRFAYQSYDQLFDPELAVQEIPLSSPYIQRIQAVYALIDYLGHNFSNRLGGGSVWTDLAGPASSDKRGRQRVLCELLADILRVPQDSEQLREYLKKSLKILDNEVDKVLWEHPRPILTTVIPTALRRLSTNWRRRTEPKSDYQIRNSPLPEFASGSLFSELNLPDVRISLPPDWDRSKPRDPEVMPIAQAMRTFAPGRVSRRFGIQHALVRHWIAPEDIADQQPHHSLDIDTFYECDSLGKWQWQDHGKVVDVPVFRPIEINPVKPDRKIRDTSNARLVWRSQVVKRTDANRFVTPVGSMWEPIIKQIETYTHGEQRPIEMRRFAIGSQADIKYERTDDVRTQFNFVQKKSPAAIGFSMTVDAVRFKVFIPNDFATKKETEQPEKWRALRTARFFDLVWEGDDIPLVLNPFMRQWLGVIFFAGITYEALHSKTSIVDAASAINAGEASIELTDILETLFQSPATADDDEEFQNETERDQLREELEVLLRDNAVLESLHRVATILWDPLDGSWQSWLDRRIKVTIAAAAYNAFCNLCPDLESGGLLVDIDPGPLAPDDIESDTETDQEFWISESSPGGAGHIEKFVARYAEDPSRFYALLTAAIQPNEYELVDYQLTKVLEGLAGSPLNEDLVGSVQAFREAAGAKETDEAFGNLRRTLSSQSYVLFHSFTTALSNRILRSGTSTASDHFLSEVLSFWRREEARLGVELDPKTIAYFFSQNDDVDSIVKQAGFPLPQTGLENWRFNVIYGMLWPRGTAIRKQGLHLYNPFDEMPDPEPLLLTTQLVDQSERVMVADEDWQIRAVKALTKRGVITLVCPITDREKLSVVLNFFATNPVTSEYLSVFARLVGIRRVNEELETVLEIAEGPR
jgi:hypothetical protein